ARFSLVFDHKSARIVLLLGSALLLIGWVWLVFISGVVLGYLLLGLAGCLLTILFWYYGELSQLAPTAQIDGTQDMAEVLERGVLGRLPREVTPKTLAGVVSKLPGGFFFSARYAIGPEFLRDMSSDDPVTISAVWQTALQLAAQTNNSQVTSAALVAGLVL